MRTLILSSLIALALPLSAQTARFIKVDIVNKSMRGHVHAQKDGAKNTAKDNDGPTEIKMRMPITLAKGILEMATDGEIKINGKEKKGIKADQLLKMLETSKVGDLLLEITTDKGDLVKITLE